MKKRFNAHRGSNKGIIKFILWMIVLYLSLVVTFNILLKSAIKEKLNDSKMHDNLFSLATNQEKIIGFDLLNPKDMFRLSLNYANYVEYEPTIDEVEILETHVNDINPRVYIYNTHDTETYDSSLVESYNIKYSVKIASYILSDHLKDLGITSYVEEESMMDYLNANNLLYYNAYDASRYYAEKRIEEYPSIEVLIDLHRDSPGRDVTYVNIDEKPYAKVLFVASLDHDNYEKNLSFVKEINERLDERLRRGILEKSSIKRNNKYNQDISDKAILIEVGGVENTIEEVNNTLVMIAKVLFEMMSEGSYGE